MTGTAVEIDPVDSETDQRVLQTLLGEYHEWMAESAPVEYHAEEEATGDVRSLERESESWAWIARIDGSPAGCVLLYGRSTELAEFKRLWVRPAHRGHGIGRALTGTTADEALARGYETLGLTTPPWSETAHALYESMGFERTPPYPETLLPEEYHDEAIFMRLDLDEWEGP